MKSYRYEIKSLHHEVNSYKYERKDIIKINVEFLSNDFSIKLSFHVFFFCIVLELLNPPLRGRLPFCPFEGLTTPLIFIQ